MTEGPWLKPPRSIAVVGASELGGRNYYGARMFENLASGAGSYSLYPVNPRLAGEEIGGHPVYGSLGEIPEPPDWVVITTGPGAAQNVLAEAARLGIGTGVVITNAMGGAEERARFKAAVRDIGRSSAMTLIGPNSMGVMNGQLALNCSFASGAREGGLKPGRLGVVSQSGSAISYLMTKFRHLEVGYSWLVSTGDEASESLESVFAGIVADSGTDIVGLFIEGITDGKRFRDAAMDARASGKPVVAIQVGLSEAGRHAVRSHTGRIAGDAAGLRAIAQESGLILTETLTEFYDLLKAFSQQWQGRRRSAELKRSVAIIASSGGSASYTVDHYEKVGWDAPALDEQEVEELAEATGHQDLQNPIDVTGSWADPDLIPRILKVVAKDDRYDVATIISGAGARLALPVATAIADARDSFEGEVLVGWVGLNDDLDTVFDKGGITALDDPARIAYVASKSADVAEAYGDGDLDASYRGLNWRPDSGQAERPVREVLEAAGIRLPGEWRLELGEWRANPDACLAAIEYPVVAKIESPSLLHRSDVGGVVAGISSEVELMKAVEKLWGIASELAIEGSVVVQEQVPGTEILMGVVRDGALPGVMVIGQGGIDAERFSGRVHVPLPTSPELIGRAIQRVPEVAEVFAGYRGRPPVDTDSFARAAHAVSEWFIAAPHVAEFEVNPLRASRNALVAVDLRLIEEESHE